MKSFLTIVLFSLGIAVNAQTYCTPSFTGCAFGNYISAVNVGGMSNTATGCTVSNYTSMTANISSGVSTPMTVTCAGWDGIAVFIDLNNDGDMVDPGELLYNHYQALTPPITYNFNITVPTGTPGGNHRLRVMCGNGGSVSGSPNPCNGVQYGNYHDYTAIIPPSLPNDVGVNNIIAPISDCDGSNQNIQVEIKNFGINQIFGVDVHWTVNNITQPTFNYSGLLDTVNGLGSNTANVTLGNLTLVGGITYNIDAWTEMPNNAIDPVTSNDTSSASVVGYNFPVVNLGNDTSTCPNDLITLNAGGGRDSIIWNTTATTQSILADSARTYIVDVWKNGCRGGDTINVGFFPQPPPVDLGNDTMICYGDSILLDATSPGVSYLWHDNYTGPIYYADTMGNYSVVIEDVNTCKSSDDINVSLFAQPVVSLSVVPKNTLCFGAPFEFRAASFTQGSTMYQWKINGANSGSPTTNNKFSPTSLNYGDSVAVQLLTDVCSSTIYAIETDYITMFINPEPKTIGGSTEDTVLENSSKNYLVSLVPGSSFTWSVVGGKITTPVIGNAISVDWGTEMDTAKIMVTEKDNANCSYTNVRKIVIKSIVGINDIDQHISLGKAYPNPANTSVTIPVVSNGNWNIELNLYDMTGKKVKAIYNGNVSGNRDFTFAVDELENGMYFYKVTTSEGYETVNKIRIQH